MQFSDDVINLTTFLQSFFKYCPQYIRKFVDAYSTGTNIGMVVNTTALKEMFFSFFKLLLKDGKDISGMLKNTFA